MAGWILQRGKSLDYLTIPRWSELGVKAAFSLRNGGVSASPYSSLNLGLHVGDNQNDVLCNRALFLKEMGVRPGDCVAAEQVHGSRVAVVTSGDRGLGMVKMNDALPGFDGMVTAEKVGLLSFYADCVPIYFYHPPTGIIALAHGGWKGTANRIVKEVLKQIRLDGASAKDCLAAIGPCIGSCCYEVGENVHSVFRENFSDLSMFSKSGEGKYHLDLAKANRMLLLAEGIQPENIWEASQCTACCSDSYFSYRRDGITGRMAALIVKSR